MLCPAGRPHTRVGIRPRPCNISPLHCSRLSAELKAHEGITTVFCFLFLILKCSLQLCHCKAQQKAVKLLCYKITLIHVCSFSVFGMAAASSVWKSHPIMIYSPKPSASLSRCLCLPSQTPVMSSLVKNVAAVRTPASAVPCEKDPETRGVV